MGIGAFEDQVTYVWASSAVFRVMQSFGVALQTALLQRACNVGQASAGARRGQDAGSALLRNEAVHTVLLGPRAMSCLVFFAQSARSCRFTLGWRRRAAQSENLLDKGRFAMKGMASTRP